MDLAWKVVVDFLLAGRSLSIRCAVDQTAGKIMFHDDHQPLPTPALYRWKRLNTLKSISQNEKDSFDRALQEKDVGELRKRVFVAMSMLCLRVRIESQEAAAPRSVHLVWFSSTFTTSKGCLTFGPRAPYPSGCTISVVVRPELINSLSKVFFTHPLLREDSRLFQAEGRQLQSAMHAMLTPIKDATDGFTPQRQAGGGVADRSPLVSGGAGVSPVAFGDMTGQEGDTVFCQVCNDAFPHSLVIFTESCGHCACYGCLTQCCERFAKSPSATLGRIPCPGPDCECFLTAGEARAILSVDDAAFLEMNEVRQALLDSCVTCPTCGCSFEKTSNPSGPSSSSSSSLKNKYVCPMCNESFCAACEAHPYHDHAECRPTLSGPLCRYCGAEAVSVSPLVCERSECRRKGMNACDVSKPCGHPCHGCKGEYTCTPCLEPGCADCHQHHAKDDYCVICYCETLDQAPCIELRCGHIFHFHCLVGKLEKRWPTSRMTFHFLQCPLCAVEIHHHLLSSYLAPVLRLRTLLESRYVDRLKIERLLTCDALTNRSSPYYNQPIRYGEEYLTYYLCFKCSKPYFGGLKQCADLEGDDIPRQDLICGGCVTGSATCPKHDSSFLEYKCRYCCNLAVWFCWGTTHFCDLCHSPPRKTVREECPGEERCPLGAKHRPNGEEFAVGCALCRSEEKEKADAEAQKAAA